MARVTSSATVDRRKEIVKKKTRYPACGDSRSTLQRGTVEAEQHT